MCLLRETGEEDGLLGQGVLRMCIETADAGLEGKIRDAHGFEFSGHDLMFRGICPECQKQAPSSHDKP